MGPSAISRERRPPWWRMPPSLNSRRLRRGDQTKGTLLAIYANRRRTGSIENSDINLSHCLKFQTKYHLLKQLRLNNIVMINAQKIIFSSHYKSLPENGISYFFSPNFWQKLQTHFLANYKLSWKSLLIDLKIVLPFDYWLIDYKYLICISIWRGLCNCLIIQVNPEVCWMRRLHLRSVHLKNWCKLWENKWKFKKLWENWQQSTVPQSQKWSLACAFQPDGSVLFLFKPAPMKLWTSVESSVCNVWRSTQWSLLGMSKVRWRLMKVWWLGRERDRLFFLSLFSCYFQEKLRGWCCWWLL